MFRFIISLLAVVIGGTVGDVCRGNFSNAVIQLALVQDATYTYQGFLSELKALMPKFLQSMTSVFPETEFALTAFVDHPNEFNRPRGYCYKLFQTFTHQHSKIINGVASVKVQSGGRDGPESSLAAILYTATDRLLGWSTSGSRKGKKVYKVIAVTTDESWKSKEEPGVEEQVPRPDARGKGRDDCSNYPPSVKLVKDVLEKKGIYLLGLIAGDKIEVWKDYMKRYKFRPSNSNIVEMNPDNAEQIAQILTDEFSDLITADQCRKPRVHKLVKVETQRKMVVGSTTNFQGRNRERVLGPQPAAPNDQVQQEMDMEGSTLKYPRN